MSEVLFQCPDCGKDVSKSAKTCPHCGNKKLKNQIAKQQWANMDPKKKRNIYIAFGAIFTLIVVANLINTKPDPCECYNILDVPTKKVGIGMPLPVESLSNDNFRKYEECYDAYAGPATAILECGKK
jgi:hypothetical protein